MFNLLFVGIANDFSKSKVHFVRFYGINRVCRERIEIKTKPNSPLFLYNPSRSFVAEKKEGLASTGL